MKRILCAIVLMAFIGLPCLASFSASWGKQLTFTTDPIRLLLPEPARILSVYVVSGSDVYVTINRANTDDFDAETLTNQVRVVSGATMTFNGRHARGSIYNVSVAAESATSVVNLSAF